MELLNQNHNHNGPEIQAEKTGLTAGTSLLFLWCRSAGSVNMSVLAGLGLF